MLTSSCPGWICYAEKTHGNFILPYISSVKSPQQIMGSLVKNLLAHKLCVEPSSIYHVTVMPCYDKKLEASRQDFYSDLYNTHDVDLVITSIEIEGMLTEKNIELNLLTPSKIDPELSFLDATANLCTHSGSSSGGYLEHVFRRAAKRLFDQEQVKLEYHALRNKDLQEITLQVDGETKLKFAFAYGFRNIQNVVQKLKRKKCTYDFIEIMACPAGCVNGGGQIRAETRDEGKELLERAEHLYHSVQSVDPQQYEDLHLVRTKLNDVLSEGTSVRDIFRTEYHEIKKNVTALNIKW